MAESGKPNRFHKLKPKPTSKLQNGIKGSEQFIRLFRGFRFSNKSFEHQFRIRNQHGQITVQSF
jgi:hypothetical protein